jgi:hypothetical protein
MQVYSIIRITEQFNSPPRYTLDPKDLAKLQCSDTINDRVDVDLFLPLRYVLDLKGLTVLIVVIPSKTEWKFDCFYH